MTAYATLRLSALTSTWLTAVAVAAFLGVSCSVDSRVSSPECVCASPLNVTVSLEGGEVDELLSLFVSLEDIRLLQIGDSSNGIDGANLLKQPKSVEVLGLDQRIQGLSTGYYAERPIDRVRVTLSEKLPIARDLTGASVDVSSPVERTFTIQLPAPILVPEDGVRSEIVVLELDTAASLTQSGVGGSLVFDPVLRARVVGANESVSVEGVRGRAYVQFPDGGVSIVSGQDPLHAHTGVVVALAFTQDTQFYDENELEIVNREEFLLRLSGPRKIVAANGSWSPIVNDFAGARMVATTVRLQGLSSTPSEMIPAIVEGRVVGRGSSDEIQLRLVELSGNGLLSDALSIQADPETLSVVPSLGALIIGEDGSAVTAAELTAGARIRVTIGSDSLAGGPFAASSIVQLNAPEHRGMLMDDAGETVLFLDKNAAAIESGAVQSSATSISLLLGANAPVLDVIGRPSLEFSALLPPLRVAASGTLTGDPSDPELANATLVVRPGRLEGIVSAVNVIDETFDASIETIHVPLGGSATSPPFQFVLDSSCVFEGSATTRADFFALFSSLEPGESLAISVAGLGTVNANEVVAYEVRSHLE